jgi:hypothetical protein
MRRLLCRAATDPERPALRTASEELDPSKGAQARLICYNLFGSGAAPIRFYMGGLHDVAREASFEAKESGESRNGIRTRRVQKFTHTL